MTPALKIRLENAKKYLGNKWVLSPKYEKKHWHTPRNHGSHVLFFLMQRARNLGRIE